MAYEILLDKDLIKGKDLTLWVEVNMSLKLDPMSRSDEWLP